MAAFSFTPFSLLISAAIDTTACSFDNGHSAKRTPFPVRAKYGDPYHRDAVLITPKSYHKNLNSKTSPKQRDDSIIRVNQGAKNG